MPAIIAGVGLYDLAGLDIEERLAGDTPFGTPSGAALRGRIGQHTVLFLARHGSGHRLLPHEVNQRADIFALKRAGATMVHLRLRRGPAAGHPRREPAVAASRSTRNR
jgi:5'-methylthioadenosine phosphorylase